MTSSERKATSEHAQTAWDEFIGPMISELRAEYGSRIVEVANSELNRDKRSDKITALSNAVRILDTLDAGMQAIIRDGEVARQELLRAEKIEQMTKPQRRLLGIAPY